MHAFSGGAGLQDATNARREMDRDNALGERLHRRMVADAARKREKAELRSVLNGEARKRTSAAKASLARLTKGHGEDSTPSADEALIESAFRKFDVDGSGTIDVAELGDALEMVLGKRPCRETVRQLFKIADADGNGVLDFDEWLHLARQGELVNRKLLNPKYRFLLQARHARANERDAQAAALAAKVAQIEETGRAIAATRAEWDLVVDRRRLANIEAARVRESHRQDFLRGRDRSALHIEAMNAKRRAARAKTYRRMVHYQQGLLKAKRASAMQNTLLDVCRTDRKSVV